MKLQEIKKIASQRGLKVGKRKKGEIIRSIQEVEGNIACFDTRSSAECGQEEMYLA
jgi:hypothetical protein